jgi:nitrous oxidase accessory protein NosD
MPGESADRRTLSVGGDNSLYSTIQSAIDQAADGDLILIQPGSYKENLVVNKAVEIRGVSRDEVILEAANITTPAILVRTGTGFVISNITVKTASSGIQVSRVSGEIRNCDIVGGRYGIAFSGSDSSDLLVSNCRISSYDALTTGDVPPTRNVGIYAYGSGVVRIEESIFERNGTAVHVSNDIVFRVALSEFESNRIAITVGSNSSGSFVGNSVTRSIENGVLLNTTGHVELINNEIFANVRHGLDLYLRECTDCGCGGTVFRGTISGSGNILDQVASICPASFAWPEDFYTLDESLGKPQ